MASNVWLWLLTTGAFASTKPKTTGVRIDVLDRSTYHFCRDHRFHCSVTH